MYASRLVVFVRCVGLGKIGILEDCRCNLWRFKTDEKWSWIVCALANCVGKCRSFAGIMGAHTLALN